MEGDTRKILRRWLVILVMLVMLVIIYACLVWRFIES